MLKLMGRVVEMVWEVYIAKGNKVERNNYFLRPHGHEQRIADKRLAMFMGLRPYEQGRRRVAMRGM
jgi:hypothetical protein